MVQQGEAHRWKAHQVSDKKARGHNIVQPNISAEFNLQWGEGAPNRWYERSEKVPTGLRALIAVNQKLCSKDSEYFVQPLAIPGKLEEQEGVLDALPPVQPVEGPPPLPHRLLHHLRRPQLVEL